MRTTTVTVTCDHCGLVQPEGRFLVYEIAVRLADFPGPFSGRTGVDKKYDLCAACYDNLLVSIRKKAP